MKTILLIDFENLQTVSLESIDPQNTETWFFVGGSQNKLPFNLVQSTQHFGGSLRWIKIEGNGKNNLDFHITFELGRIAESGRKDVEVYILSKDKGYDPVIEFARRTGLRVSRVVNLSQMPSSKQSAPESKYTESVFANLAKISTAKRPRTRASLEKHLRSAFQGKIEPEDINTVIEELFLNEQITENNNRLHYKF
jgi:hypothetical protein